MEARVYASAARAWYVQWFKWLTSSVQQVNDITWSASSPVGYLSPVGRSSIMAGARLDRLRWTGREVFAIVVWVYVLLKLAVFDVDVYLFDRLAPQLRWILDLKAVVIVAIVAFLWIGLGRANFFKTALYLLGYPAILVFWRVPKLALRNSPVFILAAPFIYRLITTFRTTLVMYTAAALAGLVSRFNKS